jgi:hypothetical protein
MTEKIKIKIFYLAKLCPLVVGMLFALNFYASAVEYVVGVNSAYNIAWWRGGNNWTQIPGAASHIVAGPYGLWHITGSRDANGNGAIFFSRGIPTDINAMSWIQVPGGLVQLDVDSATGEIWGVNSAGNIYYRKGITSQNPMGTGWVIDPDAGARATWVTVGQNCIWTTNSANIAYRRAINTGTPTTASDVTPRINAPWISMQNKGPARCLSIGTTAIFALNPTGLITFNAVQNESTNPSQSWGSYGLALRLKQISAGTNSVWGTQFDNDNIWIANDATGYNWTQVNGALKQVDIGNITATPPGGSTFSYAGEITQTDPSKQISFGWSLPDAGNGVILFKGKAAQDMWVVFSPDRFYTIDKGIALCIGGSNNTQTSFRSNINSAIYQAVTNDAIPQGTFTDYWIMIKNGTISFGKGTIPGTGQLLTWTNATILNTCKYIGFSSYTNVPVELQGITITTPPVIVSTAQTFVNTIKTNIAPADYKTRITGLAGTLANTAYASLKYDDLKGLTPTN